MIHAFISRIPSEEATEEEIRAGCRASDAHLVCSYPKCSCSQLPAAIKAAFAARLTRAPGAKT